MRIGTITKNAVDLLAIRSLDSNIFDLTDNLGKKNIQKSLDILNDLLYQKEPIQKILITLYNHFKKLDLKPNQTFLINKYKTQSRYFSEDEIRNIIDEMINLDSSYKVGLIDVNIGLEAILCRYCS